MFFIIGGNSRRSGRVFYAESAFLAIAGGLFLLSQHFRVGAGGIFACVSKFQFRLTLRGGVEGEGVILVGAGGFTGNSRR